MIANQRRRIRHLGVLVGLLCGVAHAGLMQTASQVGFGVSPTGGATYSVPIVVPPGTGGMEPKLSFVYNSQAGNGLLGVGWTLSGLSVITRCPRTKAQDDGTVRGIHFTAADRFCLDGQRLVPKNGIYDSSYGANGTEYRTERESFSKIVSYGSAGSGPAWFKVWTKAGQIIEYGNTADSRIEAVRVPGLSTWPNGTVRVWAMNKVSDTKGNFFTVNYTKDTASGDYYPATVIYTNNAYVSHTPNNLVQFTYDTQSRPDVAPAYFQGSVINSAQRLKRVTVGNRYYELDYGIGATKRSRITAIRECTVSPNICKPAATFIWTGYGSDAFGPTYSWQASSPDYVTAGFAADVDGDGRADLISQQSDGLYVSLSAGAGLPKTKGRWIGAFGSNQGYSDQSVTPILFADVNSDGIADVVGFGTSGVSAAISNGHGAFTLAASTLPNFGRDAGGWTNTDTFPRVLADVDGDGLPDIVGFGTDGVWVARNNNGQQFDAAFNAIGSFGTSSGYASNSANPRFVVDVDGDGLPDIVGFANDGVYVALNDGTGHFGTPTLWLAGKFNFGDGYINFETNPRTLADVNGDGLPDIVGFKSDGTYVSLNTGAGFQSPTRWLSDFGTATSTPYASQKGFPRYAADVNGDGKADVVGFSAAGVRVALSTGTGFQTSTQWASGFGSAAGYGTTSLRLLADVDGDGFPDIVASNNGTALGISGRLGPADLVFSVANGLGAYSNVIYGVLTTPSLYTRGTGAVRPQVDLTVPMYVVSKAQAPGAYATYDYQYGGLRVDLSGRGSTGFAWVRVTQAETQVANRTDYSQVWPYYGLPTTITTTLPGSGFGSGNYLGMVVNTYMCRDPQSALDTACSIGVGKRYFPYVATSIASTWELNGASPPATTTTSKYDQYGNATDITVSTTDGFSKTTSNKFAAADEANWFLGRLVRTTVSSTAPQSSPPPNLPPATFNLTIAGNTANYNLRNAAIAAGWNQASPLKVTINSGVKVYSTSPGMPAFSTGSPFPPGLSISIINKGYIVGAGGSGGNGQVAGTWWYGDIGVNGGNAIALGADVSIDNTNGYVFGGGGGGGGGGDWNDYVNGGGGGGGQGLAGGGGGYAGGGIGTFDAPGGGGAGYMNGGNGGAWGTAGDPAGDGTAGGAAGKAVVRDGKTVTWVGGNNPTQVKGAVQ